MAERQEPLAVRPATAADLPQAADTLGAAFADYAWTRHVVAADNHQARVRRMQEVFLERIGLPYGRVWVTDGCEAVAVWTTPETMQRAANLFDELVPVFAELAGDRADAWRAAEALLAPHRPMDPVWFLGTVGVRPEHQGKGLGKAVLRPGLEEAERAGVPAYLETSSTGNLAFYKSLGFCVTAEVDLPDGGPRTWCMVRRP